MVMQASHWLYMFLYRHFSLSTLWYPARRILTPHSYIGVLVIVVWVWLLGFRHCLQVIVQRVYVSCACACANVDVLVVASGVM